MNKETDEALFPEHHARRSPCCEDEAWRYLIAANSIGAGKLERALERLPAWALGRGATPSDAADILALLREDEA